MAAPTVSETPATQRGYLTQTAIATATVAATRELWAATDPMSSLPNLNAFSAGSRAVVERFGAMSAAQAQDTYRMTRIDAGISTIVRLPPITPPDLAPVDHELAWIESQVERFGDTLDAEMAEFEQQILAEAAAAFEKVVLDEGRETTIEAVAGDEKALGFRRVAKPGACAWCLALAIRKTSRRGLAKDFARYGTPGSMGGDEHWGAYKSRASAGQMPTGSSELNRFHFKCRCTVEPIFDLAFTPPAWLADVDALYADSDDFNDFRRRLNAQRGDDPQDPAPVLPMPASRSEQTAAIAGLLAGINDAMRVA